jgi:hypothetical protein
MIQSTTSWLVLPSWMWVSSTEIDEVLPLRWLECWKLNEGPKKFFLYCEEPL